MKSFSYKPYYAESYILEMFSQKLKREFHKIGENYASKEGDILSINEETVDYIPRGSTREIHVYPKGQEKLKEAFVAKRGPKGGPAITYDTDMVLTKRLSVFLTNDWDDGDNAFILHGSAGLGKSESVDEILQKLGKTPSPVLPPTPGVAEKSASADIKLRDEWNDLLSDEQQEERKAQWEAMNPNDQRKARLSWDRMSDDEKIDKAMLMPFPSSLKKTMDQFVDLNKATALYNNDPRKGQVFWAKSVSSPGNLYVQLLKSYHSTLAFDDKVSGLLSGKFDMVELLLNACQSKPTKRYIDFSGTADSNFEEVENGVLVKNEKKYVPKVVLYMGKILLLTNIDIQKDETFRAFASRAQFFEYAPSNKEILEKLKKILNSRIESAKTEEIADRWEMVGNFIIRYLGADTGRLRNFKSYQHRLLGKLNEIAKAHPDPEEFMDMARLFMRRFADNPSA